MNDWHDRWIGRKFRRRTNGKQQTRRVIDTTLGGDVCVVVGRYRSDVTIKRADWLEWVSKAKEVLD